MISQDLKHENDADQEFYLLVLVFLSFVLVM